MCVCVCVDVVDSNENACKRARVCENAFAMLFDLTMVFVFVFFFLCIYLTGVFNYLSTQET